MVHALGSSSWGGSPASSLHDLLARLDANRIAAGAGTVALNIALLMLLLVPLAAPPWQPQVTPEPEIRWIPRDPPKPVVPVVVPVTKPAVLSKPTPVTVPPLRIDPQPLVDAQLGDLTLPPLPPIETAEPGGESLGSIDPPPSGMQLQYAAAPPPAYPREALREGLRGTVLLQVLVDTDGRPLQVDIARSSGHRTLDRTAQRHVLARWRFRPALQDGRPVQAIGLVPIEFSLD